MVCVCVRVCAQSCLTLCDPVDCNPSGSSAHGISQAGILEWGAISSSRGSSQPRHWTQVYCVSCNGRQILYQYMTIGKPMALTIRTFVSKVMLLLFNTLSRVVIAFLPRSRWLLISWLQTPSAVIPTLFSKKIKSVTVSTFSSSICHEVMELDAMI